MYRISKDRHLILASASPRRRELLSRLGLSFTAHPADTDETIPSGESPVSAAQRLARRKAESLPCPSCHAILAADTVVVLGEEIFGKPADKAEAGRMLSRLSGQTHTVITAWCLRLPNHQETASSSSQVRFRQLSFREIMAYLAGGEYMDKAGAYAVQGQGASLVENIMGSYTNIIGLPLEQVVPAMLTYHIIEPDL